MTERASTTPQGRGSRNLRAATGVFLCLAFGAAATTAVALACSLTPHSSPSSRVSCAQVPDGGGRIWQVSMTEHFRADVVWQTGMSEEMLALWDGARVGNVPFAGLPGWAHAATARVGRATIVQVTDAAFGWPWRSLHARSTFDPAAGDERAVIGVDLKPILHPSGWVPFSRWLPTGVLWAGFTADSLLFAGASWLLFPGRAAMVREMRRRRGACEGCAYPLQDASSCPECGRLRA